MDAVGQKFPVEMPWERLIPLRNEQQKQFIETGCRGKTNLQMPNSVKHLLDTLIICKSIKILCSQGSWTSSYF